METDWNIASLYKDDADQRPNDRDTPESEADEEADNHDESIEDTPNENVDDNEVPSADPGRLQRPRRQRRPPPRYADYVTDIEASLEDEA